MASHLAAAHPPSCLGTAQEAGSDPAQLLTWPCQSSAGQPGARLSKEEEVRAPWRVIEQRERKVLHTCCYWPTCPLVVGNPLQLGIALVMRNHGGLHCVERSTAPMRGARACWEIRSWYVAVVSCLLVLHFCSAAHLVIVLLSGRQPSQPVQQRRSTACVLLNWFSHSDIVAAHSVADNSIALCCWCRGRLMLRSAPRTSRGNEILIEISQLAVCGKAHQLLGASTATSNLKAMLCNGPKVGRFRRNVAASASSSSSSRAILSCCERIAA